MKLSVKLLARSGTVMAVSAVILGTSVVQAAAIEGLGASQESGISAPARPSPDGPMEERIKQAVEEIEQKGQAALEELGELDSTEKVEQAEQVLEQMERAVREVKRQAHDRASERFEEMNDIAVARLHRSTRTELEDLGELDSEEKGRKAAEIRARMEEKRERLDSRRQQLREAMERRLQQRELPQFAFRQPNGRPPVHAVARGLRARVEDMSEEEVEAMVLLLEQEARSALASLGELDDPTKAERARLIRSRLGERVSELRQKFASNTRDQFEEQLDQQIRRLRMRAETAVNELGELDTPEKQEKAESIRSKIEEQVRELRERLANGAQDQHSGQFSEQAAELRRKAQAALDELGSADTPEKRELARQIRTRLDEELSSLRQRLSDRTHLALQEQVDREAGALRRNAQAALERLGELDTPEKQEKARQIRARLEEQIKTVQDRLAHRARSSYGQDFEQESAALRQRAQAALRELGRVDSLEKVERARQIRARLEDDIHRLKREWSRQMRDGREQRFEARPDRVRDALADQVRDNVRTGVPDRTNRTDGPGGRAVDALREHQEQRDRLDDRMGNLRDRLAEQAKPASPPDPASARPRPVPDEPPATPEPERGQRRSTTPEPAEPGPEADSRSRDRDSGSRP